MKSWIKKHFLNCFVLISGIAVLMPFGCLLLCKSIMDKWAPGDLIAYYGTGLSIICTMTLGGVTYRQTKIIQEQTHHWEQVNTKRPFFTIKRAYILEDGKEQEVPFQETGFQISRGKQTIVYLELQNCGDGPANHFKRFPETAFGEKNEETVPQDCIAKDASKTVNIRLWAYNQETREETIEFHYENILGFSYRQDLHIREGVIEKRIGPSEGDYVPEYTLMIYPLSAQKEENTEQKRSE